MLFDYKYYPTQGVIFEYLDLDKTVNSVHLRFVLEI